MVFKHFAFLPRSLGKWSNLTIIIFNWVETNTYRQLGLVYLLKANPYFPVNGEVSWTTRTKPGLSVTGTARIGQFALARVLTFLRFLGDRGLLGVDSFESDDREPQLMSLWMMGYWHNSLEDDLHSGCLSLCYSLFDAIKDTQNPPSRRMGSCRYFWVQVAFLMHFSGCFLILVLYIHIYI